MIGVARNSPTLISLVSVPPANWSTNQFAVRELTPSTPKPILGHPRPRATVAGNAKGKDAAERKEMASEGLSEVGSGSSTSLARIAFSGIDKKEGMLYLVVMWA